jgi:hypothetical protein
MKVRVTPQALRFRLAPEETDRLGEGLPLKDEVEFGEGPPLVLVLLPDPAAHTFLARCTPYRIQVRAPALQLAAWARGDDLGLYAEQAAGGGLLRIEIEKDLRPKRPRRERRSGR